MANIDRRCIILPAPHLRTHPRAAANCHRLLAEPRRSSGQRTGLAVNFECFVYTKGAAIDARSAGHAAPASSPICSGRWRELLLAMSLSTHLILLFISLSQNEKAARGRISNERFADSANSTEQNKALVQKKSRAPIVENSEDGACSHLNRQSAGNIERINNRYIITCRCQRAHKHWFHSHALYHSIYRVASSSITAKLIEI